MISRLRIRNAISADIPLMKELIVAHGANPWNYLPEDGIAHHLDAIASGDTDATLAFDGDRLVGMVTFTRINPFVSYEPPDSSPSDSAFIAEGVVAGDYTGRGLGSYLLVQTCNKLRDLGVRRVYVGRHEENVASAGALRRAGFREVETFDDFQKRPNGSRRTTVCRLDLSESPR